MNLLVTAPMMEKDLETLKTKFNNILYKPWTENGAGYSAADTLSLLKEAKADAMISELDDVNDAVLDAYHNLHFIGDCRANPANISLAGANKYRIPVICTPARNAQAVAELLVGLLVSFLRNVPASLKWIENGCWKPGETPYYKFMGNEICGKKIGFVGFGAVGRTTAHILAAFGATVSYYDPYVLDTPEHYEKQTLEALFENSDIVSIHLPVLPSTRGMVNSTLLNSMKPTAVFVNTARSAVVDMQALREVLSAKKIRGAVIDVYDHEPPKDEDLQLMQMDNVLATPHICGATYEVTDHQSQIITDRILQWLSGSEQAAVVFNKEVLQ